MKTRGLSDSTHARVRSRDQSGSRSQRPPVEDGARARYHDPTRCDTCGALYSRKTWRRPAARRAGAAADPTIALRSCPACAEIVAGRAAGDVLLKGPDVLAHEAEIRRRVARVAARAAFTQPERRIVSVRRTRAGLEIKTTSQELAHRLVHELAKAFHGRASYSWSDRDGRLWATWEMAAAS